MQLAFDETYLYCEIAVACLKLPGCHKVRVQRSRTPRFANRQAPLRPAGEYDQLLVADP